MITHLGLLNGTRSEELLPVGGQCLCDSCRLCESSRPVLERQGLPNNRKEKSYIMVYMVSSHTYCDGWCGTTYGALEKLEGTFLVEGLADVGQGQQPAARVGLRDHELHGRS